MRTGQRPCSRAIRIATRRPRHRQCAMIDARRAKILREARKAAVDTDDEATKRFLGTCYKGYIGRMVNPDMWTAKQMQHHHQPLVCAFRSATRPDNRHGIGNPGISAVLI